MAAPKLAPRPVAPVVPAPEPVLNHSDSEWAAIYPEIERLYVRERRKLRHIMQHMESEHHFKATEQMYKKRFAKWGFQKNSKRSTEAVHPLKARQKAQCRRAASRTASRATSRATSTPSTPGDLVPLPPSPGLSHGDGLTLMFLTSVRTWSVAYFESVQPRDVPASQQKRPLIGLSGPPNTREMSYAIKLVVDLLDRGHGVMAGKMARKAFLLVEDMLTVEGPVLVWNLLEMMHHIVSLRHGQLFHMLLSHLISLVDGKMPEIHPIHVFLRGLRGLVASLTTPSSASSTPSSTSSGETLATVDTRPLSHALPYFLQQAWILNAEILFDRFDPRLFGLYCRILWESCSIRPPVLIAESSEEWFTQLETHQLLTIKLMEQTQRYGGQLLEAVFDASDNMVKRFQVQPNVSLPDNYETVRVNAIATIREYGDSILPQGSRFDGDTALLLPLVAALATTSVVERSRAMTQRSGKADGAAAGVSRMEASVVACALKTLIGLESGFAGGDVAAVQRNIERARALVAIRGYAEGKTDPETVWEAWLLHDALVAAGELEEAREVERDAYGRMEMYTQQIPVYCA